MKQKRSINATRSEASILHKKAAILSKFAERIKWPQHLPVDDAFGSGWKLCMRCAQDPRTAPKVCEFAPTRPTLEQALDALEEIQFVLVRISERR